MYYKNVYRMQELRLCRKSMYYMLSTTGQFLIEIGTIDMKRWQYKTMNNTLLWFPSSSHSSSWKSPRIKPFTLGHRLLTSIDQRNRDLRRVEIARCFVEQFTGTSAAEERVSPVLALRGIGRLAAYYRAQPIYRAPVSDRDLFEGHIGVAKEATLAIGIDFKGRNFRFRSPFAIVPRRPWAVIKGRFL